MTREPELHYFHKPHEPQSGLKLAEFLPVQDFLADEPACKELWDVAVQPCSTRAASSWPSGRACGTSRSIATRTATPTGSCSSPSPVNWQIDYVVVKPDSRGQGIATQLVRTALHHAYLHRTPYVMLTSKESLRPLYAEPAGSSPYRTMRPTPRNLPAKG